MQSNFTKKLLILFVAILFVGKANAQDDLETLLRAGQQDANTLIDAYINPFMKGFGTALGNGWTNTAKPHKSLGFDLTITVNSAHIPDDELFFNVNDLNLQNTTVVNPADGKVPTVFGPDTQSEYQFTDSNGNTVNFNGPEGLNVKDEIGMQAIPVPMVNLGIGIYKNTDLRIRWTPEISLGDDGKFKLLGFAAMHDIKQHIPGLKFAPFDLSVLVGFTKIDLSYDISDQNVGAGSPGEVTTPNGEAAFGVNTWTIQGLISKKVSVLTFYGGLGMNIVKSDLGLKGDYLIRDDFGIVEETIQDPISINVNKTGPRVTAGMRLKLGPVTLHSDYTVQKYNTLTVGFGFSFR